MKFKYGLQFLLGHGPLSHMFQRHILKPLTGLKVGWACFILLLANSYNYLIHQSTLHSL